MSPIRSSEERTLRACGARRSVPGAPARGEIVQRLRGFAQDGGALVALFDARAIAGERHLLSAWAHLGRARSRGETRLRDRGAEFALFVAGDDQLPKALEKVGVGSDTEEFVLVVEKPRELPVVLAEFGLVDAPDVYPRAADERLLDRLGISPDDRQVVPPSAWEGLVLERIALLELTAPHATPPTAKH